MEDVKSPSSTSVTLVDGSSFCVSGTAGDIEPDAAQGLFVRDTRLLSLWKLLIDGSPVESLSALVREPYEAVFTCRAANRSGHPEPTLVVERHRYVGQGMREDIALSNYGLEPAGVEVRLLVDADFADLFEVKENRPHRSGHIGHRAIGGDLMLWAERHGDGRGVRVSGAGASAGHGSLTFQAVVPPVGTWSATVEVVASVAGEELRAPFPADAPLEQAEPARRMRSWRESVPDIRVEDPALARALERSEEDLGALRIIDPEHPDDDVVAAGAPWFMALFGRDSLITSWMTLPFSPELALGTARTLARKQGRTVNPMTEEQPGRILHEVRLGDRSLALGGDSVYYGSIDSTPLFVMVVGRAALWGVPLRELEPLLPAVDAAVDWIVRFGDRDGDGFVEYQRSTDRGLANQGWKDSFDAISFRDGRLADAPIALAEVQGYCYAAFLAKAELDELRGLSASAAEWRDRAAELKRRFHEAFWMPDEQFYALALDRDKRQVDSVASNIGHCLWTGIVDEAVAPAVAKRLLAPDMFTGFGIRTLSTTSARYNPVSYHNGSVWPHDSALAAAGLAGYGFRDEAQRVIDGLLDASRAFDGRLPELFCGFDRADKPLPVPYPTSCSPQAWAAAVPFELLRISLGLSPSAPAGSLQAGASRIGTVEIDNLPFEERQYRVRADGSGAEVTTQSR